MASFDLDSYETVEERHARALALYPDLRVVIINHTTPADRERNTWVVEARVYQDAGDQANDLPKATEWAFEVDGVGMANKTSALENANTSALGRALRWAFAGSKGPSRAEMEKVQRGMSPVPKVAPEGFGARIENAWTVDDLRSIWEEASKGGFLNEVKELIDDRRKVLEANAESK